MRRLLAIFAHPDDESLACGGTLARCADAGVEVTLVCATRGEAGSIDPACGIRREDLGEARAAELRAAAGVLGISEVVQLAYPDGMLEWADAARLEADLHAVFERIAPDTVITFGADGLYWHPDHIAISCRTAAVVRARAHVRPVTLYEVTMPPGAMRDLVAAVQRRPGGTVRAPWGLAVEAFGKGALPPAVAVDVSSVIDRKCAALACHRSQLAAENPLARLDHDLALAHLAVEHFHVAPGSPLASGWLDTLMSRG